MSLPVYMPVSIPLQMCSGRMADQTCFAQVQVGNSKNGVYFLLFQSIELMLVGLNRTVVHFFVKVSMIALYELLYKLWMRT